MTRPKNPKALRHITSAAERTVRRVKSEPTHDSSDSMFHPHTNSGVSRPASGHPHHWLYLYDEVWVCKRCNELTWLPIDTYSALEFGQMLSKYKDWSKAYSLMIQGSDAQCLINLMEESLNGRKNRKNKAT